MKKKKVFLIGSMLFILMLSINISVVHSGKKLNVKLDDINKQAVADSETTGPMMSNGTIFCCDNENTRSCGAASCD